MTTQPVPYYMNMHVQCTFMHVHCTCMTTQVLDKFMTTQLLDNIMTAFGQLHAIPASGSPGLQAEIIWLLGTMKVHYSITNSGSVQVLPVQPSPDSAIQLTASNAVDVSSPDSAVRLLPML